MPKVIGTPRPRFNLHTSKKSESVLRAVFRYYCKGQRHEMIYFPGEKVEVKYWDSKAQRAKFNRAHPEYVELNARLNDLEALIISIWRETGGCLPPDDFKNELDYRREIKPRPDGDGPKTPTLLEFLPQYLAERKEAKGAKRGTWKILNTWASHLQDYAAERRPGLDYGGIDWNFFNDFKNWLFTPPRQHGQNYAAKGFEVIRHFMREAEKKGFHSNQTYKGFKLAKEKTAKLALTFDELETFYNLEGLPERLEKVRDLFIIGAYTGLRFSDFTRIRPEHITEEDGGHLLTLTTQKTGEEVVIPLFPEAETLLRKYNFRTPKISNQKMNDYLKELGQLAGLEERLPIVRTVAGKREETNPAKWEKLTSHVARRSFATNFFLLGIPAAMLMKITGHATETQFMGYIAIDGKRNARELAKEVAIRTGQRHLKKVK